jgi:FAD/FMN-containing dehydrogenase
LRHYPFGAAAKRRTTQAEALLTQFERCDRLLSWGRAHRFTHDVARPASMDAAAAAARVGGGDIGNGVLAFGRGRSYGDSCLNRDGGLIDVSALNGFIGFDRDSGVLEAEAGVTLADILRVLAGRSGEGVGWFLPVTPGTKFVTLGGAVANDVHGKNHHVAGCFGNHVLGLRLARSDGSILDCSPDENVDLFSATIGGMGLTGLILSVRLQLKRISSLWMENQDVRYDNLADFFALSEESVNDWEYTVAWIDCLAGGDALGRGVFSRSRHAPAGARVGGPVKTAFEPKLAMPMDFPGFALNNLSIRAFNAVYWRRVVRGAKPRIKPYDPVFYPLDAIGAWNRMYGRRGFFQYQCVVPTGTARDAVRELLGRISRAGKGSFLAVLKTTGDVPSPGMMSFPMPGATLALDFPNEGASTHRLLDALDAVVAEAGGRIYPAKDGRVSARDFQRGYPQWTKFARHVDPRFQSSFWRRVAAS